MTNNQHVSDVALQNLLAEHADALIKGIRERRHLLQKYRLAPDSYAEELMATAEQVLDAMPHVSPSDVFMARLYEELVGTPATPFWERWAKRQIERLPNLQVPNLQGLPVEVPALTGLRHLSPRVQLAAAGLGGVLLVIAARAMLESNGDHEAHNDAQIVTDIRTA
jgi:hypothetical protein